jgi:AcrR family transcriptional regulator
LVDCAIEVIAEEGFGQASLARIAQRAGVAKSVVLYHFANKEELIQQVSAAVSQDSFTAVSAPLADAVSARDKLRVILETVIGFIDTHRTHALAGLETWNMLRSLPARDRLPTGPDGIEQLFVEGQRNGEFGEFDPHVLAIMVRQAIDAAGLEAAVNPDVDLKAFTAELVTMFDRATRSPARE